MARGAWVPCQGEEGAGGAVGIFGGCLWACCIPGGCDGQKGCGAAPGLLWVSHAKMPEDAVVEFISSLRQSLITHVST